MNLRLDRRQFLRNASWGALAAFHSSLDGEESSPSSPISRSILISGITLVTGTPLPVMRRYYEGALGLELVDSSSGRLTVRAGASTITFVPWRSSETNPEAAPPFYHFAFNIPENKILDARARQLERNELFLTPENLRDPSMPTDVRHFRSWNAHSVFFADPAGNVLEYIARHDLDNARKGAFGVDDILSVSEIGMTVDDVEGTGPPLESAVGIAPYRRSSAAFRASGDENGLLLLFARGRDIGDILRGKNQPAEVFRTKIELVSGSAPGTYEVPDYPHEIIVR